MVDKVGCAAFLCRAYASCKLNKRPLKLKRAYIEFFKEKSRIKPYKYFSASAYFIITQKMIVLERKSKFVDITDVFSLKAEKDSSVTLKLFVQTV